MIKIRYYLAFLIITLCNISVVNAIENDIDSAAYGFAKSIFNDPATISSYDIKDIVYNSTEQDIKTIANTLKSIKTTSISRKSIKNNYLPLCFYIINKKMEDSTTMKKLANGRNFNISNACREVEQLQGMDIYNFYDNYVECVVIISMIDNSINSLEFKPTYGNLHFVEKIVFGDNSLMRKKDQIPQNIIKELNKIGIQNGIGILDNISNTIDEKINNDDSDYIIKNAYFLLYPYTYWKESLLNLYGGKIISVFVSHHKNTELKSLLSKLICDRWGKQGEKLLPIIQYRLNGNLEIYEMKQFIEFRDSLLANNVYFAKYLPHNNDLIGINTKDTLYRKYNALYFEFIKKTFSFFVSTQGRDLPTNVCNYLGVTKTSDFLNLYTKEVCKRYYGTNDLSIMAELDRIYHLLDVYTGDVPINVIEQLSMAYMEVSPRKSYKLVSGVYRDLIIEKMANNDFDNASLFAIALYADIYVSLYNQRKSADIEKILAYVENNYEKVHDDGSILFELALTLNKMERYEESEKLITKYKIQSEYADEVRNVSLDNNYHILNEEHQYKYDKVIELAKEKSYFSLIQALQVVTSMITLDSISLDTTYINVFLNNLNNDFNQFLFMDDVSQEQSYSQLYSKVTDVLTELNLVMWLMEEDNIKKYTDCYPYVSTIFYNWALASKGALLRSYYNTRKIIENSMTKEEFEYFISLEESESNNLVDGGNFDLVNLKKEVILDCVRKNQDSINFPKFDYNRVKEQLEDHDIAIEFMHDLGIAVAIRKQWNFPRYVIYNSTDDKNRKKNYADYWSCIEPLLDGVERIYYSLDGKANLENIELLEDNNGITMMEKYKMVRVSTTINLGKDLTKHAINNIEIFADLKYKETNSYDKCYGIGYAGLIHPWMPLPSTKKEANIIKYYFKGKNIKVRSEYEGSKTYFLNTAGKYDIIHLATHAFYWPHKIKDDGTYDIVPVMQRTGIVFSNSEYDVYYSSDNPSGTCFANEISNVDLSNVKLVVLSACETAQGELGNDGTIVGIQRALKQAGVGSIIMSLKEVDSETTLLFMELFYSNFSLGYTAREAFRMAQKGMLDNISDDWKYFIFLD